MSEFNQVTKKNKLHKSTRFTLKDMTSPENIARVRDSFIKARSEFDRRAEVAAKNVPDDFFGVFTGAVIENNKGLRPKPKRTQMLQYRAKKFSKR